MLGLSQARLRCTSFVSLWGRCAAIARKDQLHLSVSSTGVPVPLRSVLQIILFKILLSSTDIFRQCFASVSAPLRVPGIQQSALSSFDSNESRILDTVPPIRNFLHSCKVVMVSKSNFGVSEKFVTDRPIWKETLIENLMSKPRRSLRLRHESLNRMINRRCVFLNG